MLAEDNYTLQVDPKETAQTPNRYTHSETVVATAAGLDNLTLVVVGLVVAELHSSLCPRIPERSPTRYPVRHPDILVGAVLYVSDWVDLFRWLHSTHLDQIPPHFDTVRSPSSDTGSLVLAEAVEVAEEVAEEVKKWRIREGVQNE